VTPATRNQIVHARLRVGETLLMGSDAPPDRYQEPRGVYVSVGVDTPSDAERIFAELAEKGTVQMPIGKTFFAERFWHGDRSVRHRLDGQLRADHIVSTHPNGCRRDGFVSKIATFLWFDDKAAEAAEFYVSTFRDVGQSAMLVDDSGQRSNRARRCCFTLAGKTSIAFQRWASLLPFPRRHLAFRSLT